MENKGHKVKDMWWDKDNNLVIESADGTVTVLKDAEVTNVDPMPCGEYKDEKGDVVMAVENTPLMPVEQPGDIDHMYNTMLENTFKSVGVSPEMFNELVETTFESCEAEKELREERDRLKKENEALKAAIRQVRRDIVDIKSDFQAILSSIEESSATVSRLSEDVAKMVENRGSGTADSQQEG